MIKLTNVNLEKFGERTIEAFKARLADFYLTESLRGKIEVCIICNESSPIEFHVVEKSIAFKNFCAFYNNTDIPYENNLARGVRVSSDIEEISRIQRPVVLVDNNIFTVEGKKQFTKSDGTITENELHYVMKGWIGIHTSIKKEDAIQNDPTYLKNKAYRPNQLRLYVRKKLAVENFLDYVKNTQALSNYIEGEISFDILDDNELGDIATSNRQGFVEDDERVVLLIEIIKPIITNLIKCRVKLGNQVKEDEIEYNAKKERALEEERRREEKKRKEEEEKRKIAEEEKKKEEQKRTEVETKLKEEKNRGESLLFDLRSEKKRNSFLFDTLSNDQLDFTKRLHMLSINSSTISSTVRKSVMKLKRNTFSKEDAVDSLKKISQLNSRNQAVLKYGAIAKFDTKEEYVTGDLFSFIEEYCSNVLSKNDEINVALERKRDDVFNARFSPQDIVVIIENAFSNSKKHFAKVFTISMRLDCLDAIIEISDDGEGINPKIINVDDLFEFGKSFSDSGTGIGLFHIKDIVQNKMKGAVSIISSPHNGFTLEVRLKNEI